MSRLGKSFLVALIFVCAALTTRISAQVAINEIHYNPPGDDPTVMLEYIELHNRGASPAVITNWRLTFGALPFVFPSPVSIPAGGYVVVAENPATLQAATGFLTPYSWAGLGVGLDNGGETITLEDAGLVVRDSVSYDDGLPWPTTPDGSGPSLELLNPALDNNASGSWLASTVTNGTPGTQNSVFSNAPTVQSESPVRRTSVIDLPSVSVTFNTSVTGVVAGSLTVGGSPATSVSGTGAGPYVFSGYSVPVPGSVTIALSGAGILAGAVPFGGDSWTVSTGINVVINELHYHPFDVDADAEFLELHNPGAQSVDISGWKFSAGIVGTFPAATILPAGGYVVFAKIPSLIEARTGYAGSIAWTSGSLSNGGEAIGIADAANNVIDSLTYSDSGVWPTPPDGDGPSLELINPAMPNQYGGAWRSSVAAWGTPGAVNSTYVAAPPPIINDPKHTPLLPLPNQSITVTALVLDDGVVPPTVTLNYRQDFDPTIAYSSTPMLDDGAHGDGAAGDNVFGATVPGLADGQRLDFTIRADDGTGVSAGPSGHNTLVAGENPAQTYLCKFSNPPTTNDLPHYHLITTQHTRTLQDAHNENEYDGTFVHCNAGNSGCVLFYNVVERYRGQSSLNQHPHSFRVNFPASNPLQSEMGFPIRKLNTMSQMPDRQGLGYQFFREAFNHAIPTHSSQFIRYSTDPLSHGGVQDYACSNVEAEDADFTESEGGAITPPRWPSVCTLSLATCSTTADCGALGGICFDRTSGNLYKGVLSADFQYLGTDPNSYRTPYEKQTNETEDDFTDVIELTRVLDPDITSDANYEAAVDAIADEDEWARYFAINMLLVNQEGGIYRDTGDDFLLYMEPPGSPLGYNAKLMPRDQDSVFGGFGAFNQETIWRTNLQTTQRFIRNNAYAGRFVGAICDLLNTDFTPAVMNPRIDALPPSIADAARKAQFKAWVAARIVYVNNEIVRQTTITGVPASPYTSANPVIALSGQLNQCGTYRVLLNGAPVTSHSVYGHTWSASYTLVPGPNEITVQSVDVDGAILDQATANVVYAPPGVAQSSLRLTVPSRMLNAYTLSLKAEVLDSLGRIDWRTCDQVGSVSATRVSDNSVVPISVTVFDPHLAVPADSIRFYNGIGSVSFTLDNGAAEPAGDIRVTVTLGSLTATKIVTIVSGPTFRSMSGTLAGADLTWGPNETIRITGGTTVPSGSALTINPGTLVLVNTTGGLKNGTLINVNGSISAVGSNDNPIHFFSERNQLAMALTQSGSASNADAWRGFELRGSASSTFKWVILTGAGNGVVTGHPRPPIVHLFDTHNLLAEDSTFVDNNGMVFSAAGTGNYTVRRLLISRCGIGAEFNGNGHTLLIEDSWWTSCGWAPEPLTLDGDLLHIDGSASNQTIRRSIFADSGDDGIDHSGSNFTVDSIIIRGILDKAISMTGGSVEMHNSLIFGSGSGIRGLGRVYNSTIASGNVATPEIIQQSILWTGSNNSCSGDIDYNILGTEGDVTCGVGNLWVNPQFTGSCDFNPQPGSPALTAGPTGGRIGWLGFPTAATCLVDSECSDSNPCSLDSCQLGVCAFTPIVGCTACTTAADCNDGNACTTDTCGALGTCQASQPVSCDDGNACTTDTCDTLLGCQHSAANCDDGNVCTDDSCVGGACQHTSNTASCSDGNLCTVGDVCGAGTCGGTPVGCPVGQTCNPGTGACQAGPTVVSFQQGASGYFGTADTYIDTALGSQAVVTPIVVDGSPVEQVLLQFVGIFGNGAGQIPPGSTISSATLTLWVGTGANDQSANAVNFHQLLNAWSDGDVWAAYGVAPWNATGGIQNDGVDALAAISATATMSTAGTSYPANVTTNLQAWVANPSTNFGWVILATGTDGLRLESSESANAARRPLLSVTFNPPAVGCTIDADCDDNNLCTGVETCVATVCQPGTPLNCDDTNVCTTDSCSAALGCQNLNNTASCSDGNACTANDACAGGSCVGGAAPNCDDGNVCTDDSCNTSTGCVHANNTASCSDANLCTTGDVCSGGTCGGTAVSCPIGQTCNPGTGTCQSGPTTATFQQGVTGYAGAVDTFVHVGGATTDNGAAVTLIVDGPGTVPADERQILLRFDSLFASQGGPIPDGATIASASLQINITNISADGAELHRMLVPWTASSTWNSLTSGVQRDDVESVAAADVSSLWNGALPRLQTIDVTSSVAAWSAGGVKYGWVFVTPAGGSDSWQFDSSEGATLANRPLLSVTFAPPAVGCTIDADCDDNNLCTGVETCVATVCQPGTAPNCDDGNVCTTDSCVPATGCAHANNTNACSDNDSCTTNDTCSAGSCVGGPAPNCDDGNVCTTDSCVPASGCAHVNNTVSCADGLFCNGNEVCGGGLCQPGTAVNCDDGIACTGDSCNEASDACEHTPCSVTVVAAGSRWLDVTPPTGLPAVALKVSAPGFACLPKYIDAAGALTASPVFQSSAQWGTIHVGDRPIVPLTGYTVDAEVTPGTPVATGTATTWAWGNGNNVDDVNVFDIVCALDGFQGIFTNCTPHGIDQNGGAVAHPVAIDLADILAVLDAFSGVPYPDATPCLGLFAGAAAPVKGDRIASVGSQGRIVLSPSAGIVPPGGTVRIDVYGEGLLDVRGYQVNLETSGGYAGTLVLDAASIDSGRGDHIFRGQQALSVTDPIGVRLAGALWSGGVTSSAPVYLGSFDFKAGQDARGTFQVSLALGGTSLWDSSSTQVTAELGASAAITVGTTSPPRRPRVGGLVLVPSDTRGSVVP